MSRAPQLRRAQRALALAVAVAVGTTSVLSTAGTAAGQEGDSSSTTAPTESTTTSTTAPPSTVVLEDGDFGVVPPGADDPGTADDAPPGEDEPGQDPIEPGGESEVPPELAVAVLPDPTPGLNAALGDLADADVMRARAALAAAEDGRRAAELATTLAYRERAEALARRREASGRIVAVRAVLEELAVNAVMYGAFADVEPVLASPSLGQLRDLELMDVTVDRVFEQLAEAQAAYRDAVARELEATEAVAAAEATGRATQASYLLLRAGVDHAMRTAEERRRQVGPPILGPSVVAAPDLVDWYRTYYAADPPVAPIADIIDAYLRVGAEEGVAGDIAFAQAILETGGFRSGHARGYNFAGIGAYDRCSPDCGFRFPDLDDGVRAHIHLLRAYADPNLVSSQLSSPPDARVAPERVGVRGCCQRWTQLTGIWATDPNYDRKVLGIYRLMVEIARSRGRLQT